MHQCFSTLTTTTFEAIVLSRVQSVCHGINLLLRVILLCSFSNCTHQNRGRSVARKCLEKALQTRVARQHYRLPEFFLPLKVGDKFEGFDFTLYILSQQTHLSSSNLRSHKTHNQASFSHFEFPIYQCQMLERIASPIEIHTCQKRA